MQIEPRHLNLIKAILGAYPYVFFIFGSRVKEKAKRFSDLDLFYKEPIPMKDLLRIEEAFEESDLPYKVDLIDYHSCDEEFQKILQAQSKPFVP